MLQVPLAGNADALEACVAWECTLAEPQDLPEAVQAGFERAEAAAALRAPNEDAVGPGRPADADLLAAYMAYINLEEVLGSRLGTAHPSPACMPPRDMPGAGYACSLGSCITAHY